MRNEEHDTACLWDILDRAKRIQSYLADKTLDDYLQNQELQDAVERCVEVIGEAANRLSESFKEKHPEIPWRRSVAQRHVLAHDYDEIRPDRIYQVAVEYIPLLIGQIEPLLPPLPPEAE